MFSNTSIRFRIILLSLLGMTGMCVIAGANKYLDSGRNIQIQIGSKSHYIAKSVLQSSLIEEQFRNSPVQALMDSHGTNQNRIKITVGEIEALSSSSTIQSLSKQILQIQQKHSENFSTLAANAFEMNGVKGEILKNIQSMTLLMTKMIADIEKDEAMAVTDGEVLDGSKGNLRVEFKDFMGYWNVRLVVIQNLFLTGNREVDV